MIRAFAIDLETGKQTYKGCGPCMDTPQALRDVTEYVNKTLGSTIDVTGYRTDFDHSSNSGITTWEAHDHAEKATKLITVRWVVEDQRTEVADMLIRAFSKTEEVAEALSELWKAPLVHSPRLMEVETKPDLQQFSGLAGSVGSMFRNMPTIPIQNLDVYAQKMGIASRAPGESDDEFRDRIKNSVALGPPTHPPMGFNCRCTVKPLDKHDPHEDDCPVIAPQKPITLDKDDIYKYALIDAKDGATFNPSKLVDPSQTAAKLKAMLATLGITNPDEAQKAIQALTSKVNKIPDPIADRMTEEEMAEFVADKLRERLARPEPDLGKPVTVDADGNVITATATDPPIGVATGTPNEDGTVEVMLGGTVRVQGNMPNRGYINEAEARELLRIESDDTEAERSEADADVSENGQHQPPALQRPVSRQGEGQGRTTWKHKLYNWFTKPLVPKRKP